MATRSIASRRSLNEVTKALEAKFGEPKASKLVWKPQTPVAVDDETGEKLMKLDGIPRRARRRPERLSRNFELSDAAHAEDGGVAEAAVSERVRILGLDPGLRNTGWGVITIEGTKLPTWPAAS